MIIITDSIRFAEKSFGTIAGWKRLTATPNKIEHTGLLIELYRRSPLYIGEIQFDPLWHYAFVTEHSEGSQFEVLKKYFKKHAAAKHGILCLAEKGTNFKGQRDRNWVTVAGNIHLSTYLNPAQKVGHFNLGFAILPVVSVLQAVDECSYVLSKAAIKWVNDVLIDGAKIAGALTQTQVSGETVTGVISGIGINVETKPPAVADLVVAQADCLNSYTQQGNEITLGEFLEKFLAKFSVNYKHILKGRYFDLLEIYRQRSAIVGRKITVLSDPINDRSKKVTEGIVRSIGENLELFLENHHQPVIRGRVVLNN